MTASSRGTGKLGSDTVISGEFVESSSGTIIPVQKNSEGQLGVVVPVQNEALTVFVTDVINYDSGETTGTITALTHGMRNIASVQAYDSNNNVITCDIQVNDGEGL